MGGMAQKQVAVILAGAVAKGAYAAGVLEVLAAQDLRVTRIVAASSGALNAALYASYVRRGCERAGMEELATLWEDHAGFWDVFSLDLISLLRLEGLSSGAKVRQLLRERIEAGPIASPRPISLRFVVAPLAGMQSERLDALTAEDEAAAGAPARDPRTPAPNRTTYEHVADFDERTFEKETERDRMIEAALASAAFPFVFVPVGVTDPRLGDLGPCIDGGAVNNAPIKWAMGGAIGDELDAVIVVTPTPELDPHPSENVRGTHLVSQAVQMLINERLYRDVREAERVNDQLARLEALVPGQLSMEQLAEVKRALGWSKRKQVRIVQIRPTEALDGSSFSGFGSRPLRREYLRIGRSRARAVLEAPAQRWMFEGAPAVAPKLRSVP